MSRSSPNPSQNSLSSAAGDRIANKVPIFQPRAQAVQPEPNTQSPLFETRWLRWVLIGIGGLLLADVITSFTAEGFWFWEVGYVSLFWLRVLSQGTLALGVFALSLLMLWGNLRIAHQRQRDVAERSPDRGLRLRALLPLTLGFSFVTSLSLFYYVRVAINHWHPRLDLYGNVPQIPLRIQPEILWQLGQSILQHPAQLLALIGVTVALLVSPNVFLWVSSFLTSLGFALVLSENWIRILPAFRALPFEQTDPLLNLDLSFYIFYLPLLELLNFWLLGLFGLTFLAVALVYLLSNKSLSNGRFRGFGVTQLRHLYGLGAITMVAIALSNWLDRYELLFSAEGVTYGASFTDVWVRMPGAVALTLTALGAAAFLFSRLWNLPRRPLPQQEPVAEPQRLYPQRRLPGTLLPKPKNRHNIRALVVIALAYAGLTALLSYGLPLGVQSIIVQPNELELELPYLERTIAYSRNAFALDEIESSVFDPQTNLTLQDLEDNALTLDNVRLWDTRPLKEANRQLQRIRPYYEFPSADVDRYLLPTDEDGSLRSRQVLIALRELDYNSVPAEAQTWVNKHLIYTHGYGFTLSPVNVAAEGGLPDYFVEGIEQNVSDPRIREAIPIGNPRIYFGELSDTHVMTQTRVPELDYPSGSENVYHTYDGRGGIPIGAYWKRLLYAKHLRDWRMLFSADFTENTRILFRRNIVQRVQAIAPFLRFDTDPYPVVVDLGDWPETNTLRPPSEKEQSSSTNYLYWIMDAYTTSDRYPYSDPIDNDFNYIRNSVKVVIDAYNGSVWFFVANPDDPIIQTWSRLLPGMFQPLDDMPVPLLQHIRYPQDYYNVQAVELMTFHMTDPRVFYNREDQWRSPTEIYGDESRPLEPYYLIMKLPIGANEEFILFSPFAPAQRTNLIAWMAARSDDEDYGKILLYRFPKQELVFGIEQIEARINQDPVISQQISLWNRRGSQAIQGNLLIIPIEDSLLYVEPLYLQAEQNQIPSLARVIVAYGNRIVMAETLPDAIDAIFDPNTTPQNSPTIIRPLDDDDATGSFLDDPDLSLPTAPDTPPDDTP